MSLIHHRFWHIVCTLTMEYRQQLRSAGVPMARHVPFRSLSCRCSGYASLPRSRKAILKGMAVSKGKTMRIRRNAITGRFVPVEEARRHPRTSVVETIGKAKGTSR